MKVPTIVILVLFVLSSDITLVNADMALSYKIINDRKSQATVTSSIQVESLVDCAQRCMSTFECKSAQYKQGRCEFMIKRYACLYPNVKRGWKYIFIDQIGDEFAQSHDLENVALRCPAQASSYQGTSPNRAVDGVTDANHRRSPCAHTSSRESDPWWGVDLEVTRTVYSVAVTNRGDCCFQRLHDFTTYVSSDVISPLESHDKQICKHRSGQVGRGVTVELTCRVPVTGRFFSLLIPGANDYLNICEVVVMGV